MNDALDKVRDKIRAGAQETEKMSFEDTALDELRKRYEGPFQAQHDAGADWTKDKVFVLPMAYQVGVQASQSAVAKGLTAIDTQTALEAGHAVSKICHFRGGGGPESGVYCAGFPAPPPPA
ncbi:MAG TPA: hypothetical protein VGE98_13470 [Thermoanaerobaculia bacterium]